MYGQHIIPRGSGRDTIFGVIERKNKCSSVSPPYIFSLALATAAIRDCSKYLTVCTSRLLSYY